MNFPATRHEIHYGDRIVRCFAERPANVDALLRAAAKNWPDRPAMTLGDDSVTYGELDAATDAVAAGLLDLGLRRGDRVAVLLGNGFEFLEAVLGCARAGLISVPMNVRQKRPETEFVLNQCQARALVYDAGLAGNLPDREATPDLEHLLCVGDGHGRGFATLKQTGALRQFEPAGEEEVFCLLYTSGTTGRPKGAMLTHLGVIHSVMHFQYAFGLGDRETAVLAVPASHVTGLVAILLTMVRVGGNSVIMPAFKARTFLEIAQARRMTYTLIVPAMYNLCLLDPDFAAFDLSAWRTGGFGGAPMPQATIERLMEAVPGLSLRNCYGSTETTSPATILPDRAILSHRDSVGRVLPCADVVVVDDDGREVSPGGSGELLIGGPMTVPGYWNNPEANRTAFVGGYWVSGDIGSKDADGFVRVFDRRKDMINRAGYKVYCIEVESVLSLHQAVLECAVVGDHDPVLGEKVHAFIHARDGEEDADSIRAWCAERLSDYKVPDRITFLSEPLPRNANGKVLKTALRERAGT